MLKPTNFANLPTPAMAQTWQSDLPDHLRLAAQVAWEAHQNLQYYACHIQAADVRDDVKNAVENANAAMEKVYQSLETAAEAAQDWVGDVSAPRFTPVAADSDDTGAGHIS